MSSLPGTVYLVDDDASIRTSVARLLRIEGFLVESFRNAEEFLEVKTIKRPSCLVSDIRMPGLNGLALQEILMNKNLRIPIVFITGHGEIPMSVSAMKNGAVDFLPKPFRAEQLLQSVRQCLEKDRAQKAIDGALNRSQNLVQSLSDRERQVLQGVVSGMLNKQIAFKLGITEKTIKVHRASMMLKMKATSVPHLVRLSETAGISAR